MVPFPLRSCLLVAVTACASLAQAAGCNVPAQIKAAQENSITLAFQAVFMGAQAKGVDCGSIASVWQKVALRERTGGRKLEPDAPLDLRTARLQWEEAQRNPAIAARLAAVQKGAGNAAEVAIYQAAILDEEGFYSARDARVSDLVGAANLIAK